MSVENPDRAQPISNQRVYFMDSFKSNVPRGTWLALKKIAQNKEINGDFSVQKRQPSSLKSNKLLDCFGMPKEWAVNILKSFRVQSISKA